MLAELASILESGRDPGYRAGIALLDLRPQNAAAVPTIARGLSSDQPDIRRISAKLLGEMGPAALPTLSRWLENGLPSNAGNAATVEAKSALASFRYVSRGVRRGWHDQATTERTLQEQNVRSFEQTALPVLTSALQVDDPAVRESVLRTIADAGLVAVPTVLDMLSSQSVTRRPDTLRILRRIRDSLTREERTSPVFQGVRKEVGQRLLAMVQQNDSNLRSPGLWGVANLPFECDAESASPLLRSIFEKCTKDDQTNAARAVQLLNRVGPRPQGG